MSRFFISSFLLAFLANLAITGSGIAQDKDIYGNTITPEVAQMRARVAREDAIRERRIIPGMTENEVIASLGSANSVSNHGSRAQWVYYRGNQTTYVHFENGRVR